MSCKAPAIYQLVHLLLFSLLLPPPRYSSNTLGRFYSESLHLLFPQLGTLFPHCAHVTHSLTSFRFLPKGHHLSETFLATSNCNCSPPLTFSSPFLALFLSMALITNYILHISLTLLKPFFLLCTPNIHSTT